MQKEKFVNIYEHYLYLGNQVSAQNMKLLKHYDISLIVSVGSEFTKKHFPNDFDQILIDVKDNRDSNILTFLEETIDQMQSQCENDKKVFVHCYAGISRSVSVLIGQLMKYKTMYFKEAINHIKLRSPTANPNQSFKDQLKAQEIELGLRRVNIAHQADVKRFNKIKSLRQFSINDSFNQLNEMSPLQEAAAKIEFNYLSRQKHSFRKNSSKVILAKSVLNNNIMNSNIFNESNEIETTNREKLINSKYSRSLIEVSSQEDKQASFSKKVNGSLKQLRSNKFDKLKPILKQKLLV